MRRSLFCVGLLMLASVVAGARPKLVTYPLEVLPPEHRMMTDPKTGAKLIFLTTNAARDNNLYFHQRSFLADDSMALFTSRRKHGGLMGYIFATGELVSIRTPKGAATDPTAAKSRNSVFAVRKNDILELGLKIDVSPNPAIKPSRVTCTERIITTIGAGMKPHYYVSENSNGRLLAVGVYLDDGRSGIVTIDINSGRVKLVCTMDRDKEHGHCQFSRTYPNLLTYAGEPRIMLVNTDTGAVRPAYDSLDTELVTHESWWVDGLMTFCGGFRKGESDVKVLNPKTGQVRVIGVGAWWPEGTPAELAKQNWWHANGDEEGRWVAADNWHGEIAVFDAKTTRTIPVTYGHRTYGGGEHPHVGWDRSGKRLIFTSNMLGVGHVCVATIPDIPVPVASPADKQRSTE